jgi:DNA-binding transcriptional MerR regulator
MPYTMRDLVARSGLAARTLRAYGERGLIPRARGRGPSANFDEEHMARAVAIGRMRAAGKSVEAVFDAVDGWELKDFQRYVAETDPKPAAVPSPEAPRAPPLEPIGDATLPAAPAWRMYSLLNGLGLVVDTAAPPVVHRIAMEILTKYGSR